jgi:hypothetical protein
MLLLLKVLANRSFLDFPDFGVLPIELAIALRDCPYLGVQKKNHIIYGA